MKNKMMQSEQHTPAAGKSRLALMTSMVIFGTIGIFRSYTAVSSTVLALSRAWIGMLFLFLMMVIRREKPDTAAIRKNLRYLLPSGTFLGFNWILLFEAYRYTSVASATLCYYMAPMLVILFSPLVLGEKLTARKAVCVLAAILGMIPVSGILKVGFQNLSEFRGIFLGLGAAVLYACIVLLNKKLSDISAYDRTLFQLALSAVILLVYTLMTEPVEALSFTVTDVILLLILGIVHTGIAYALYFGSMQELPAHTVAMCSYIDPVLAIILSAVILRQPFGLSELAGAVLILGSAYMRERGT